MSSGESIKSGEHNKWREERASRLNVGAVVVYCLLVDRFGVASARSEWRFEIDKMI